VFLTVTGCSSADRMKTRPCGGAHTLTDPYNKVFLLAETRYYNIQSSAYKLTFRLVCMVCLGFSML